MKISKFVDKEKYRVFGEDKDVLGLSCDSKKIDKDDLFFCINGTKINGHDFANEAVENGASCVVCEKVLSLPSKITQIVVPNVRSAMGEFACNYYQNPQKNMKIIMITGTNGKTTSTYMLKHILENCGLKVGVIGTNGTMILNEHIKSNLTTPDPIELFYLLKQMKEKDCDVVCMEASAHAIALNKLDYLKSDISVLTNITQDHLDFFGNMENYKRAKAKLFLEDMSKSAVFNIDNEECYDIYNSCQLPQIAFGSFHNADIKLLSIEQTSSGQNFKVKIGKEVLDYSILLDGKFNVYNALGVISVAEILGLDRNKVAKSLETFKGVPGRFNKYIKNGVKIIIDYAHTPDGIKNVLEALKEITKNRVITVFGCGGNRDSKKRPIMGQIASTLSDYTIITSDNPRFEDPLKIIDDICLGVKDFSKCETEANREMAIKKALRLAKTGDVVAILGKGNENYLDINGEKVPYSDEGVLEKV